MNTDPVLAAALVDIDKIRSWCSVNPARKLPETAVAYLCTNAEAFVFLLFNLDCTTRSQREALFSANPKTLDYSVIDAGTDLARGTLTVPSPLGHRNKCYCEKTDCCYQKISEFRQPRPSNRSGGETREPGEDDCAEKFHRETVAPRIL